MKKILQEVDVTKVNPTWLGTYAFIQAYNDAQAQGLFPRSQTLNIEWDSYLDKSLELANGVVYMNPTNRNTIYDIHDVLHMLTQNIVQHFQSRVRKPDFPGYRKSGGFKPSKNNDPNKSRDAVDDKKKFTYFNSGELKNNNDSLQATHGTEEVVGNVVSSAIEDNIVSGRPIDKFKVKRIIDGLKNFEENPDSDELTVSEPKPGTTTTTKDDLYRKWAQFLSDILPDFVEIYNGRLAQLKKTRFGADFIRSESKEERGSVMNKKELEALIKESVIKAMEENFDSGDHALHKSVRTDRLIKDTDQLLDVLRGVIKQAASKREGEKLLQSIHTSLSGFVSKVVSVSKMTK